MDGFWSRRVWVGVGYGAANDTGRVSVSVYRRAPWGNAMVIDGRVDDRGVQILELRAREGIRCGHQREGGDKGSDRLICECGICKEMKGGLEYKDVRRWSGWSGELL